jgi:hypothetical protein
MVQNCNSSIGYSIEILKISPELYALKSAEATHQHNLRAKKRDA